MMLEDAKYYSKSNATRGYDTPDYTEEMYSQKFVTFKLNDQHFGIKVENVIEVLPYQEITPVVHTPSFVKGVLNLRGQIICILDLKNFFELDYSEPDEFTKIIFVVSEEKTAGLIVDYIDRIHVDKDPTIESIPATVTGKMSELLSGVINIQGKPLMIINLHNLFNSEEFKVFD